MKPLLSILLLFVLSGKVYASPGGDTIHVYFPHGNSVLDLNLYNNKEVLDRFVARINALNPAAADTAPLPIVIRGNAANEKRVAFHLFENPATAGTLDGATGGWEADNKDPKCGKLKFHVPTGRCYIYLIGNAQGSFLNFFPQPENSETTDNLSTRQEFMDNVEPEWEGNVDMVDGYLPMTGMANSNGGLCTIKKNDSGQYAIFYTNKNDGNEYEIKENPHTDTENPDRYDERNSFVLKRLMSKVKVDIRGAADKGITFTPVNYCIRHVAQKVSPTIDAWSKEKRRNLPTRDTEVFNFSTQSPNSFTVYLPESIREYEPAADGGKETLDFKDRDQMVKDDNEQNVYEKKGEDFYEADEKHHQDHYKFQYAPKGSTYVEITGRFEQKTTDSEGNTSTTSADVRYIVHLGDFSDNYYNKFSLERDCYYIYNITVTGINSILVEVLGKDGSGTNKEETAPGTEGVVFKGGARVRLDAHYEQVEMEFNRNEISKGVYLYTNTPFGSYGGIYYPAGIADNTLAGKFIPVGSTIEKEDMMEHLKWVEFKKQTYPNELATYKPKANDADDGVKDVFTALDEFYASGTETARYTCFVNEYYYTERPGGGTTYLSDFVNAADRTFSLASDLDYSNDGKSAVAQAVYVLQQRSIACFYDLTANDDLNKYGVETVDEVVGEINFALSNAEKYNERLPYGVPYRWGSTSQRPTTHGEDVKDGRTNTITELELDNGGIHIATYVNVAKNGYLLVDGQLKSTDKDRLQSGHQYQYLACLTRNRDLDGDGTLTKNELRWYTPARDQVFGLWIGEPGMPTEAALFPEQTSNLENGGECEYPIFTSSANGNNNDVDYTNRVIWAEQGCSFGSYGGAGGGLRPNGPYTDRGYLRVVRNLGAKEATTDSHTATPSKYYYYDEDDRTISVFLSSTCLRAFSNRELAPHHERSLVNRPHKKFQVAKHPYVINKVVEGRDIFGNPCGHTFGTYDQLQVNHADLAKDDPTTWAASYPGDGEVPLSAATWRLPNQRELALMVVALGVELDYSSGNEYKTTDNYYIHIINDHNQRTFTNKFLHCRTAFSNANYTNYGGYMYNTDAKAMQFFNEEEGYEAGYYCVRDVQ